MVSCRFRPGMDFLVLGQNAALVAEAVHFHAALAVRAHQDVVVLALDAVLADDVALVEARELGRIQIALADFAHVPDHVRGQPVARIQPMLGVNHLEFGKRVVILVRVDERQLGGRELFFNRDGMVLRLAAGLEAAHARHQSVVVQIQAFGDRPEMLHLQVFARQIQS